MKRKSWWVSAVMIACLIISALMVFAAPGGEDDPIVSQSYLDNVFMKKVTDYIDTSGEMQAVNLTAGQTVIGNSGAEMILRMGKATVIATEKGGLADVTAGYDKANGEEVASNHLMIVPLSDGRGIKAQNDVIVLIRGKYTIQ